MKLPISAFIICQDEEQFIEACIRSVEMCAEIIVVDSGSTDLTLEILDRLRSEGFPLTVLSEKWRGYGAQKQFALEQCRQPWCLSIDSDERISPRLARDLPRLVERQDVVGWRVSRYPYLEGFGYAPPKAKERFNLRLIRKGAGAFDPADRVHEGIRSSGKVADAPQGGLLHFRPIMLHEQILKENKYSTLKAEMRKEQGRPPRPFKMVFSPILYFFKLYFRYGLWRGGWAGYIGAATGATYSFLTEAKRWENEAIRRNPTNEPDFKSLRQY